MLLIIESADEQVLQKIEEPVRPFQVFVRKVANDTDTVSPKERNQRVALVRKFRGGYRPISLVISPLSTTGINNEDFFG